ncbi:MAG: DUF4160 domain-containing protein [Bacteroidota bacterium]|nr:DUF4160 domain-containing protein [Bacteroidota bacterium]
MPRISEFYGIIIAIYSGQEVKISIDTLEIIEGKLRNRALVLVLEWAILHRSELELNWNRARRGYTLKLIEPLK